MGKSCHNPGKTFRINITRAKLAKFHTIHHKFILIPYTPENVEEMIIMRKQVKAILAAMLITGVVAIFMAVIGVNAMTNRNGTVVSNSPQAAAATTNNDLSSLPADIPATSAGGSTAGGYHPVPIQGATVPKRAGQRQPTAAAVFLRDPDDPAVARLPAK